MIISPVKVSVATVLRLYEDHHGIPDNGMCASRESLGNTSTYTRNDCGKVQNTSEIEDS